MTKKDYIKIAATIKGKRDLIGDKENWNSADVAHFTGFLQACDMIAESMSEMLVKDNPDFNRNRFLQACGYYD